MNKVTRTILCMMAAVAFTGGCEFTDAASKKLLPYRSKEQPAGADSALKSLSIAELSISPDFDPATLDYSLYVARTTGSLAVEAIGPDGAAVTAAVNGGAASVITEPLYTAAAELDDALDENDITVTVVSEDGLNTAVYTIRVYYLSSNAGLGSLSVTAATGIIKTDFSPAFSPSEASGTVHTVTLNYWATEILVNVAPAEDVMTVMVDGWNAPHYDNSVPITNLPPPTGTPAERTRDITVTVTSQDESTTKDYIIRVTTDQAPSTEARLKSLVFSYRYLVWYNDVGLLPSATAAKLLTDFAYSCDISWVITAVTLKFEVEPVTPVNGIAGRISIDGGAPSPFSFTGPDANGMYSGSVTSGGNGKTSEVYIDITAKDGSTVKTYKVTIKT